MKYNISAVPCYSEDVSIITLIITELDGNPISKDAFLDALLQFVEAMEQTNDYKN